MNEKVCMFVWNHFTNDARVLRECTALAEQGYQVDLICIHDPKDPTMPYRQQISEQFIVHRVKRYPQGFIALHALVKKMKENKLFGLLVTCLWAFFLYMAPIVVLSFTLLAGLTMKTKLKKIIVNGCIIARMVAKGYRGGYHFYHANDLNTLPQGYICAKWRLKKKALIYDSHEVQTSRTGYHHPFYGKLERFLIKKIDTMIVENHTRAAYNETLYGFYPNVVHNYPFVTKQEALEKIDVHALLQLPPTEKILLYQGGIQTGRGLDKLIEAVPHFQEGTVVLIGDGKIKRELQQKVAAMQLEHKVKFLPKVPLKQLPAYTENAYIGFQVLNNVCFNHYSASSNKLFEYMMAGVPVVACSFPEIQKVVEGEQVGLCIDSHDPMDIARGVNILLQDESLRNTYAAQTKQARDKFNWKQEQQHFLAIYNAVKGESVWKNNL